MIDWQWVGASALWVLGLAVLLATGSYGSYWATQRRAPARPGPIRVDAGLLVRSGVLLVCLGLTASGGSWVERALWGVIAFSVAIESVVRGLHREDED